MSDVEFNWHMQSRQYDQIVNHERWRHYDRAKSQENHNTLERLLHSYNEKRTAKIIRPPYQVITDEMLEYFKELLRAQLGPLGDNDLEMEVFDV